MIVPEWVFFNDTDFILTTENMDVNNLRKIIILHR